MFNKKLSRKPNLDVVAPPERRKQRYARFKRTWPASWYSDDGTITGRGVTIDVSAGGIGISCSQPVPVGVVLNLEFHTPDGGVTKARGPVMWCREMTSELDKESDLRFGIEFSSYEPG